MVVISAPSKRAVWRSFSMTAWCSPSAQGTFSSGVLWLVGRSLSTALGSVALLRISSKRAAV